MVKMAPKREFLQWELAETERLMESIGEHPFMSISYREKIKRLREEIEQLSSEEQKEDLESESAVELIYGSNVS